MASYLPILTFHMIDDNPSVLSYSPQLFKSFMAKLNRRGYRIVSLNEAVETLSAGQPFPESTVVLTFDDGYRSVFDVAFPLLDEYGMTATVFLTVGDSHIPTLNNRLSSLNGIQMLSWQEIKEMNDRGITFGAHTLTHPDLTQLNRDRVEHEISASKGIIEEHLGNSVISFAYPYGRYDDRSMEVARQYFDFACSDELGLLTQKSNPYALERVDSYYLRSENLYNLLFSDLFPTYVQLRNIPRRIKRRVKGK